MKTLWQLSLWYSSKYCTQWKIFGRCFFSEVPPLKTLQICDFKAKDIKNDSWQLSKIKARSKECSKECLLKIRQTYEFDRSKRHHLFLIKSSQTDKRQNSDTIWRKRLFRAIVTTLKESMDDTKILGVHCEKTFLTNKFVTVLLTADLRHFDICQKISLKSFISLIDICEK